MNALQPWLRQGLHALDCCSKSHGLDHEKPPSPLQVTMDMMVFRQCSSYHRVDAGTGHAQEQPVAHP